MISKDYLRWVRQLGCSVDSCVMGDRSVDAAHTGPRGLSQKSSDFSCIPLCRRHHQEFDANPRVFALKTGIDIPALVEALNDIGLTGLSVHRPARKVVSPQFIRSRCVCGWQSGWFRLLRDAQQSLHSHLADQQNPDTSVKTTQRVAAVGGAAG